MNRELPDVKAGFRKGRQTRDQIANIHWVIEKGREFQKNICFIDYTEAFDYVDHNKLWKMLQEMGIPDYCLLRNLYVGQEATVRTGHGKKDCFKTGKGVPQGCISSPCLFNLYAEYIMQNARLDESQPGIKIAGRNINNLRYDITLMTESEEKLKSLLMRVKEGSEKPGLSSHHPRRGSQQHGWREERQRSGYSASRRLSARRGPQAPGSGPPRRHDAQEEGQFRRGGGEGGAQEEVGEVVS